MACNEQNPPEGVRFAPLQDRVLLKRAKCDSSKSGIVIPDTAKKKQEIATIVAVGPGRISKNNVLIPMPVKVGDTVIIGKYAGQDITIDGEEFLVVNSGDIIAIMCE